MIGTPAVNRVLCLILSMLFVGCTPSGGEEDGDEVVNIPDPDAAITVDGGMTPDPDGGPPMNVDAATPADMAVAPPPDMAVAPPVRSCEALGFTAQPFQEGGGDRFGDLAGDFTLNTLAGPWRFSERWLGCESYVFLNYFPDLRRTPSGPWAGDQLWSTGLDELLERGAANVHYFFVSYETEADARQTRMEAMQTRVEQTIRRVTGDEDERAQWRAHFHFVTDPLQGLDGGVGVFVSSYLTFMFSDEGLVDLGDRGMAQPPLPFTFGIGRDQRFDPGGSLSPVVGQDAIWGMTAYFSQFYNHRAALRDQVASEEATVIPLLDEEVTDRVFTREVMLPDAAAMAGFDTLEVDVGVTCPHRNPFGCSEWDRIARISLCRTPDCSKRWEVVRWITPYWRRGHRRWLIDASFFLGELQDGGPTTFYIEMGPGWERGTSRHAKMDLRLSQRGTQRSRGVRRAYTGGGFDANYNANHEAYEFMTPDEATRVELVVILSGHGQTDGDNCAEWCDHRHVFSVNGTALPEIVSQQAIGTLRGCAYEADAGVSPGQWGNWAPGRAYWCPGLPVEAIRMDITEQVMLGGINELTYAASLAGEAPRGGNIDLSVYTVWYVD